MTTLRSTPKLLAIATVAILLSFSFLGGQTQAKPVINGSSSPPTPSATLLDCDQDAQKYNVWTIQSSSSEKDKLQQRYETQVRGGSSWKTINRTEWRSIPREGSDVTSETEVEVSNANGKEFRERVHFRWVFRSRGKRKTKEVVRTTKNLSSPVSGNSSCKF